MENSSNMELINGSTSTVGGPIKSVYHLKASIASRATINSIYLRCGISSERAVTDSRLWFRFEGGGLRVENPITIN